MTLNPVEQMPEQPVGGRVGLQTVEDVARDFGVSKARMYELIRQGLIPVVRLGRQIRLSPDALDEWIRAGGQALPGGWKREVE